MARLRVVLTRERERKGPVYERLVAAGHEVRHVPLTRIVDGEPFPDPSGFDGVLFTSVNAVRRAPVAARWPRIGAVGEATAAALRERGLTADVVGSGGGAALARAWGPARGERLLLPQAEEAHPDLERLLREGGAIVTAVAVYRTRPRAEVDRAALEQADLICFFAPSQVSAYRALGIETRARLWAVGPTTRAAMQGLPNQV